MGPLLLALGLLWAAVAGQISSDEPKPEFLAPLENMTAVQGREVTFTCVVNHLGLYKVAWIKSDSKAILAIHTHLVAHNPRLSVTHNGHNTWKLHVSNVQRNDSGSYMCQVNTDPMTSQMGYLDVVVPPDILSDAATDAGTAPEGGSVRLRCEATGVPDPSVVWRREDGKDIIIRPDAASQRQAVRTFEGETLVLSGVQRTDMGIYFCIASNGVPPSVSKRFTVNVNFQPMVKVSNQLVAAPIGSNVTIQCYVEASPKAMTSWHKDSGGKLMDGIKYTTSETPLSSYSLLMHLTISHLELRDFGTYTCTAVNAIGKGDGGVRLQELQLPPKTTTAATHPFGKLLPPPTPSRKKQGPHVKDPGTSHKRKKPRPKNEKRPPDYDDSFAEDEDNNLLPMGAAPTTPGRILVLFAEGTLAPHTPPRSNPRNTPSSAVAPTRLPVLVLVYSAWACI